MMEEKTMDIKDIFARHGSRPCPLSIAEAKQLKLDSDELRNSVASQSGAVAGDGGRAGSLYEATRSKLRENTACISAGANAAPNVTEDLPPPTAPDAIHPMWSRPPPWASAFAAMQPPVQAPAPSPWDSPPAGVHGTYGGFVPSAPPGSVPSVQPVASALSPSDPGNHAGSMIASKWPIPGSVPVRVMDPSEIKGK